jgi:autotransporter-associated beta strand protein
VRVLLGTVPAGGDGGWTFDYSGTPLPPGPHTFSATGTGAGGTSSPAAAPFVVTIDTAGPAVSAIRRQDPPTAATVAVPLTFRVTFPEPVSGVGLEDFVLTLTGTATGTPTGQTPLDDQTYDVLVSGVTGEGTLRLDLRAAGTGIVDRAGNPTPGGFTAGQAYTIRAAGSGVWVTPESGAWSAGANWQQGEVAAGPSATADFASLDVTEEVTVHLDAPRSLGHVVFGDTDPATAAGWRVQDGGDAANVLTLAAGVGSPSLTVNPLGTAATAVVEVALAGTAGLTKAGAGTLVLARANTVEGPLNVGRGTLRLGPGAHLAATTLTVAGNISELNVAGGTVTASGLATLTPRNSAIVIDSGAARFDGGVTCTNTRDAIFRVRGGTVSASSLDFPRTSDATINFGSGLLIQGGDTVIGPVGLGTVNSWGVMSVEAGALTVTGPLTVGHQVTAGRGGAFRVTGGTFRVTDAAHGIVMSRNPGSNPNNVSQASFLGGVSTVERLTLGYDATVTAGSATVTLAGGALYLGAGGIVRNGTGTFAANLNFGSGTLGAAAPWGTAVGITLPAGGTVTLKAADAADVPRDIALSGVVAGAGGFTKTGAGALELGGANTFTGGVRVHGGTLKVEGSLSPGEALAVNAGGSLAGGGTAGRDVLLNEGGTVAAGGAAGLVLTTGPLTWSAGGRLAFELSAGTRLAVGGPLLRGLPGAFEVALSSSAPLPVGESFTLATYGSTDFTAADLTYSGLPGYRGVLLVDAAALRFLVTGAGASAEYTHWEYSTLPEEERGAAADPDADGVANLLEFVVGTDPRQPSGDRTAATTVVADGEAYPALAYVRRQERGGAVLSVRVSPDLAFSSALEQVEVSVEPRGDGLEDVLVRSTVPLSQQPRQFFRLEATLPED